MLVVILLLLSERRHASGSGALDAVPKAKHPSLSLRVVREMAQKYVLKLGAEVSSSSRGVCGTAANYFSSHMQRNSQ